MTLRLTRAQVREVDRLSIEKYHVPGVVLMENAARAVVDAIEDLLPRDGEIGVLCGPGNNGGDGLAIARHLHNRGFGPTVVFGLDPARLTGDALAQWRILQAMKLPAFYHDLSKDGTSVFILRECEFIIDALFGTGLTRPPGQDVVPLIETCNWKGPPFECPVVSIDLPSGLDCDTGEPLGACVRATRTVTFVADKAGFANPASKQYTGEVIVGDIGCPREAIEEASRLAR
jgi:NAD(P)H-hydrate epimerase